MRGATARPLLPMRVQVPIMPGGRLAGLPMTKVLLWFMSGYVGSR